MCGRYRRRSDKQRIAEAFAVCASLEEIYFEPGEDIAPDSVQPVVLLNEDGVRQIELMRWAFRIPKKLLFNARSEDIMQTAFWKDSFEKRRCIVPADAIFEWQDVKKGKKPKYVRYGGGLEALEEPKDRQVGADLCHPNWSPQ